MFLRGVFVEGSRRFQTINVPDISSCPAVQISAGGIQISAANTYKSKQEENYLQSKRIQNAVLANTNCSLKQRKPYLPIPWPWRSARSAAAPATMAELLGNLLQGLAMSQ